MFGLLMRDNTPVDPRYRSMGFTPGGPYFTQKRFRGYGIPPSQAARVPQYNGYGIPPGVAARIPQFHGGVGFVPGGPYYPRGRGYGWVDATGGGDDGTGGDSSPLPGTSQTSNTDSANWTNLGTGVLNLGTSIVNAIAGGIRPQSGAAGSSCPSGYYLNNGRCVPAAGGGFSVSPALVMGAVGVAALFFLTRKKG